MIYLDTSFLTPLFREEVSSAQVTAFLARQATGTVAASKWTSVEFASLISRDVRMRTITAIQGRRLIAEFAAISEVSLVMLTAGANDFELALEYVSHFAPHLRGPDALHLAIARNNGVEFVATLDAGMLAAAKRLKIPARRVIRQSP
jgi:uncharacterized protein